MSTNGKGLSVSALNPRTASTTRIQFNATTFRRFVKSNFNRPNFRKHLLPDPVSYYAERRSVNLNGQRHMARRPLPVPW